MTLTEIANKHTCDKGTQHYEKHGYTEKYQKYILPNVAYDLLEIGIWHGDSIKMWQEYNPLIKIYAIDIDESVKDYISDSENVKIHIGNQSDAEFLKSVVKDKSYDFIIDDGSHKHSDIIDSFKFLYDYVKQDGYYMIEDLHAAGNKVVAEIQDILSEKKCQEQVLLCNDKLLIIKK